MKRKIAAAAAAAVAMISMGAGPVAAQGHTPPPKHGHIMLIGVDLADFTYKKCVDLAGGRAVPLQAHHAGVHTGRAGEALEAAAIFVIPTADIAPGAPEGTLPEDCAGVDEWLAGMTG